MLLLFCLAINSSDWLRDDTGILARAKSQLANSGVAELLVCLIRANIYAMPKKGPQSKQITLRVWADGLFFFPFSF